MLLESDVLPGMESFRPGLLRKHREGDLAGNKSVLSLSLRLVFSCKMELKVSDLPCLGGCDDGQTG